MLVESASINLECGTQVEVYLKTEGLHFRVAGNVTVLRKGNGIGVAFLRPSARLAGKFENLGAKWPSATDCGPAGVRPKILCNKTKGPLLRAGLCFMTGI